MIQLSRTDLDKYRKIGSGKFGTVYQIDDTIAYKIYYEYIKNARRVEEMNPALFSSKFRIRRLIARDKKLQYTDLIKDYIMINGEFRGVVIPYYEGETLDQLENPSYQLKRDLAIELVRNHKELLDHRIYPTDYHLGNIMVCNGKIKLIDLDDHLTYACSLYHPLLQAYSTGSLNETIRRFFHDKNHFYNQGINSLLEYEAAKYSQSLDWLDDFLKAKERIKDYLLIDIDSDINIIRELLSNHPYRVLFIMRNYIWDYDQIAYDIESLRNNNIPVYDILNNDSIDTYFNDFPVREKVLVRESNVYSD